MSVYDDLKRLIEERPAPPDRPKAIKAKYPNDVDARELWPHVLGKNSDSGYDVVLCYQWSGPAPSQGFRCFKVENLTLMGPPYVPTWQSPKKFKFKDVMRQNCVEEVDVFR